MSAAPSEWRCVLFGGPEKERGKVVFLPGDRRPPDEIYTPAAVERITRWSDREGPTEFVPLRKSVYRLFRHSLAGEVPTAHYHYYKEAE